MFKRHNKVESAGAGRFVRVGRDLVTIALDDRLWWRLLVPVADNAGLVFTDRHHFRLYRIVFKISGGSTDNPWSNGRWMDDGRVYKDRVIPLEFLATTEQADKIAAFALIHYDQMEILCVPISDSVRRYRRAMTKSHQQRAVQEAPGMPLARVCEENGAASGGFATSSTLSSGDSSPTRVLPLAKAARPLAEGSSSPESDHEDGRQ